MRGRIFSITIIVVLVMGMFVGVDMGMEVVDGVEARTIFVDDDGGYDYTTIQAAIASATNGDTIFIYNGIYDEAVNIHKSVNLVGETMEGVQIIGSGDEIIYVNNAEVNIREISIHGSWGDFGADGGDSLWFHPHRGTGTPGGYGYNGGEGGSGINSIDSNLTLYSVQVVGGKGGLGGAGGDCLAGCPRWGGSGGMGGNGGPTIRSSNSNVHIMDSYIEGGDGGDGGMGGGVGNTPDGGWGGPGGSGGIGGIAIYSIDSKLEITTSEIVGGRGGTGGQGGNVYIGDIPWSGNEGGNGGKGGDGGLTINLIDNGLEIISSTIEGGLRGDGGDEGVGKFIDGWEGSPGDKGNCIRSLNSDINVTNSMIIDGKGSSKNVDSPIVLEFSQLVLLNTSLELLDYEDIEIIGSTSFYEVKWYLTVSVHYANEDPIEKATIWINDTFGTNVCIKYTDSAGNAVEAVSEYKETIVYSQNYNPYFITAIRNNTKGMGQVSVDCNTAMSIELHANFSTESPVANAGPDQTVFQGEMVYFDGSGSYDTIGYSINYTWDFGDGTPNGYGEFPYHNYSNPGTYTTILTVTSLSNLTDNDTCTITVLRSGPIADAGSNQTAFQGYEIEFDGSGSFDPNERWIIETVDHDGYVGTFNSIVVDSHNIPHISYYHYIPPPPIFPPPPTPPPPPPPCGDPLKYAQRVEEAWNTVIVDNNSDFVGLYTSIDVDSNDNTHISYYDQTNTCLKYARWTGSGWSRTTVVDDEVFYSTSISIDNNDYPHIAYNDKFGPNDRINYARWTGSAWDIKYVAYGQRCSLALDSNDIPHIIYTRDNVLNHARLNGSSWDLQVVDSQAHVSYRSSIKIDNNDLVHISYYDLGSNNDLKYALWDGTIWNYDIVDENASYAENSLALDLNNNPYISYSDFDSGDYKIKYAERIKGQWNIESVDIVGDYVYRSANSIDIDSLYSVHISYYDILNENLKYAYKFSDIISYLWDFGDGSPNSTELNPTHIYLIPGVYNVTLTVIDSKGYQDTDTCTITVLETPPPNACAGANKTEYTNYEICLNGSGSVSPQNKIDWYEWNFGDGSPNVTGEFSNHTYTSSGIYEVILMVTDTLGRTDSDSCWVTIIDPPPPNADAGPDQTVFTWDLVQFDGSGSNGSINIIETYIWDFKDGSSNMNEVYPVHIFCSPGIYNVTLTVSERLGFTDSDTCIIVVINPPPPIAVAGSNRIVYAGEDIHFDGSSSIGPHNPVVTYEWDFNDGSPVETGLSPIHIFDNTGIYNISLMVTDRIGLNDTGSCTINVIEPPLPVADAGPDQTVYLGDAVNLNGSYSYSPNSTTISYDWNPGDGSPILSGMHTGHAYYNPGIFHVMLTITNERGISSTDVCVITVVNPPPPVADAGAAQAVYLGDSVQFDGSGSYAPHNPITNYEWHFGDGSPLGNGMTTTHAYNDSNVYTVTLIVTDSLGYMDSDSCIITVLDMPNQAPVADAGSDRTVTIYESLHSDGSNSFDPDGYITTYLWDFGDGAGQVMGENTTYVYSESGIFTITLIIIDDQGARGSDTCTVTVVGILNSPPTADAGPDKTVYTGQSVFLDGSGSSDPDGDITNYWWVFDDGAPSQNELTMTRSYDNSGIYNVTLAVTDSHGEMSFDSCIIIVLEEPNLAPMANAGNDRTVHVGETVIFDGSNSSDPDGDELSFAWNFGDGSPQENVVKLQHIYDKPGVFIVTLTVVDTEGESDYDSCSIIVYKMKNYPPIADAGFDQTVYTGCPVYFNGLDSIDTDGSIESYWWDFDDGSTPVNDIRPVHIYQVPGAYLVMLTVFDDLGDADYDTCVIWVLEVPNSPPLADAGLNRTSYVEENISFNGSNSSDTDGQILEYIWDFGDGQYSSGQITTHIYSNPGMYLASLLVVDDDGGRDVESINITVIEQPPIIEEVDDVIDEEQSIINQSMTFKDDYVNGVPNLIKTVPDPGTINGTTKIQADIEDDVNVTLMGHSVEISQDIIHRPNEIDNRPPKLEMIEPKSVFMGQRCFLFVKANDPDEDEVLTFSDDSQLVEIDPVFGVITFIPKNDDIGYHFVNITVTDSQGEEDTRLMAIKIEENPTSIRDSKKDESPFPLPLLLIPVIALFIVIVLLHDFVVKKRAKAKRKKKPKLVPMKVKTLPKEPAEPITMKKPISLPSYNVMYAGGPIEPGSMMIINNEMDLVIEYPWEAPI